MQYMAIITWEPPQRDAVLKRFAAEGVKTPSGVKILGSWGDIHGGRVFILEDWGDVNDPKISVQFSNEWTDLCKVEAVPVTKPEEIMKFISSKK